MVTKKSDTEPEKGKKAEGIEYLKSEDIYTFYGDKRIDTGVTYEYQGQMRKKFVFSPIPYVTQSVNLFKRMQNSNSKFIIEAFGGRNIGNMIQYLQHLQAFECMTFKPVINNRTNSVGDDFLSMRVLILKSKRLDFMEAVRGVDLW